MNTIIKRKTMKQKKTNYPEFLKTIIIEERIERVKDSIEEKHKEVKKWNSFISGFSTDAYRINQEIEDLETLIDYDIEEIAKIAGL